MDGTQVGILEQANQVGLAGLLQSSNSSALEPEVSLEVLGNLTDQTLEGQLANKELSGFLISPNFTQSHSSRPVSVGLLDSSSSRSRFTSSLSGQLLPRSLSSGRLASCLLGTGHGGPC